MAALNHNPQEMEDGYPEGIYSVRVKFLEFPYEFKSGNVGMRIQLDCWNLDTGFQSYENIVTSLPRMKWKLKEFCGAFGIDFDKEDLDSEEFLGKEGRAEFVRKAGDKWLSVDHYLSVDAAEAVDNMVDEKDDAMPF